MDLLDSPNQKTPPTASGSHERLCEMKLQPVCWVAVHELLIKSALQTEGVLEDPKPFVLELDLNDNYMFYQINAYIKNADEMPEIMSDLLQHIQDNFHDAEIDLVAPHFFSKREGEFPKDRNEFRRIHSLD